MLAPANECPSRSPRGFRTDAPVAHDLAGIRRGLVVLLPELYARAMRLCKDRSAAEDLVQDTVVRTLRFAEQYDKGSNLRAWTFQILFSVFVTRYRRQRREKKALASLSTDPSAWTSQERFATSEAQLGLSFATQGSLDALPTPYREVLTLVDIQSKSYRDAATSLGVPVGTVMSRLHRGRKLLAERLSALPVAA